MKFKEFLKLIKQFDCKALEEKEVEHCFVDKLLYGYSEPIVDFKFDAKRDKFRIVTGDIDKVHFDNQFIIKSNKDDSGKKDY